MKVPTGVSRQVLLLLVFSSLERRFYVFDSYLNFSRLRPSTVLSSENCFAALASGSSIGERFLGSDRGGKSSIQWWMCAGDVYRVWHSVTFEVVPRVVDEKPDGSQYPRVYFILGYTSKLITLPPTMQVGVGADESKKIRIRPADCNIMCSYVGQWMVLVSYFAWN